MSRRLLLLVSTSSYRAGAFLDAALRVGLTVTVGSDRAQALATANPSGHLVLDLSDVAESARAIEAFAAEHPVAAVVAADDDGVVLAAEAARRLGLTHAAREGVERARDKRRFRDALVAAGVASPAFVHVPLAADPAGVATRVEYPCVLKPLALSASRGVIRADDPAEFVAAFRRIAALLERAGVAAGAAGLLVEHYVPGVEVALEGVLTDGALRTLAVFDKPDPLEGPFFEETLYVTPSRLPAETLEALSRRVADVARAIGLAEGPVHAELRVNPSGVWPIELAPRPIGGLCSRTLRFTGGVSLEDLILRHALGEDVSGIGRERAAAGVMMVPIPRAGVLVGVDGLEAARRVPGIEEIRITIPIGDRVVPLPEGARYLGFVFARADTPDVVEAALRQAHGLLTFDIRSNAAVPGEAPTTWSR